MLIAELKTLMHSDFGALPVSDITSSLWACGSAQLTRVCDDLP